MLRGLRLIIFLAFAFVCQGANFPLRDYDPVVMNGNDLYELIGVKPESIVGFRYEDNGKWTQVPIQVDEMHMQDWSVIKNGDCR